MAYLLMVYCHQALEEIGENGVLFAGCFLAVVLGALVCGAVYEGTQPLFFIERSKNSNIVQYDVRVTEDGNLAGEAPVHVYWVLEDGDQRELSGLEKRCAYGIESQKRLGQNRCKIVLAAFKERPITVKKTADGYKAFVQINGTESILERVYVKSGEGLVGLPIVHHVDIFGRNGHPTHLVTERIFPN